MSDPFVIILIGGFLTACITGITSYASYRAQKKQTEETDSINKAQLQRYEILQTKTGEAVELVKSLTEKNKELDNKIATQNKKTELIKQKAEEITQLTHQLNEKASVQNEKTDKITQLAGQLEETQKELKNFTSESLNYLTGGDSWCYIALTSSSNSNELRVRLYHKGKYPLIALRVVIVYTSELERVTQGSGAMKKGFLMAGTYSTDIPVGTVPKSHTIRNPGILIGTVPHNPNVNETYHINFTAQNGEWYQTQSFTFDADKYRKQSTLVVRDGKELLKS